MVTRKGRTQRKNLSGQPHEANASALSPDLETVNSIAGREAEFHDADQRKETADRRQETADLREETADLREHTANLRQEAADQRHDTAELRQDAADLRQEAADLREETADLRQEAADQRHDTAELRQDTADLRQKAADLRDKVQRTQRRTAMAKAVLSARSQSQLREANENLIIATVHAQSMTDVAEQATREMAYMAEHDFLTGLPNRALLTDRLTQSIALAQRQGKKLALMYLDLDHFKHINDSLGHAIGDQLLLSVAKRLQACVRLSDTVSRQGGDEFVVLLLEVADGQDAALTAKKLLKAMARTHMVAGHRFHVTLSIGISLYPDDGKDVEEIVMNADIALYQAKEKGRNNYQLFTPEMSVRAFERQAVEQALHHALKQCEFLLHYQPKVNLATGAVSGAEALLRWQRAADQDQGQRLVCPGQFVSIAEECGLILPIGKWVMREACRQTQAWLQAGLDPGQIAVNVSSVEFHNKDFLATVRAILVDTGLDPHRLEIELTESGLMQDTEQTTESLRALKELGVQIAIDDFGTGYSSLSYLWRFPIDVLKIDQSFVQAIESNGSDGGNGGDAIVSAVIAMGMSLKQRVVAEGIETRQQLAFLQSRHCTEGQGYFLGRPVAAEEFATLLVAGQH